jgi:hypothetical protein
MPTKNRKHIDPVKLICGLIYSDLNVLHEATKKLTKAFGPVDCESDIFDFDHTDYYKTELGGNLIRKFISFKKLIHPGKLADIKHKAIDIERVFSEQHEDVYNRRINIDPGYMELSKLVLASTKNYSHRIYQGKGIYAEITLVFRDNKFKYLPWTYPDYVDPRALDFFEAARNAYKEQL